MTAAADGQKFGNTLDQRQDDYLIDRHDRRG
jgi:hypothetical protein